MKSITLPGTDLSVSRFVFGTSSLFNVGTAAKRHALLHAAADHGFTHYDTAPYYGFGMAERDLRPVLARHPGLTVTTKVGIYSPGGEDQTSLGIILRKAGGRIFPALSRPAIDWNVARARESLDGSLRRLGRDRIDVYMLHEPHLGLLVADEWLGWLEREVAAGRVRRFGLALDDHQLRSFGSLDNPLCGLIQTIDSLEGREADLMLRGGRALQITYGYVSAAMKRSRTVDVQAVLAAAIERNRTGAIIVSTARVERLAQYGRLLAQ